MLHAVRRINLQDEIVFTDEHGEEYNPQYAFVVTGRKGLVLVLAEEAETAGVYADAETA